jgi:hypothetical protein
VLAAGLGAVLVRLLGWTWRVRFENRNHLAEAGWPVVFGLWHGELLPLLWAHRNRGIAAMISSHEDGEIIARIVATLGFVPVRGSTSRGGARALLESVRWLREGRTVAFTTDGPRGPRRRSSPGAITAARRGAAPLVPVGAVVDRAWRFGSWDRFVLPKPFAHVVIRYGARFEYAGDVAAEDATLALDRAILAVCQPDDA